MKPRPKIFALVALAFGMLASAYLIGPAPAAATAPIAVLASASPATARPASAIAMAAVTPSKPASTIKTLRAPVPLQIGKHDQYFDVSSVPDTVVPGSTAPGTAPAAAGDGQQASAIADDATAKASIQTDGYRNVRGLVRASDGSWHGRAMRGSTEIAVSVDPTGNVSQD
jgi:hypothetical protein